MGVLVDGRCMHAKYIRVCKKCGGELRAIGNERFHKLCTKTGVEEHERKIKAAKMRMKTSADYNWKKLFVSERDKHKCYNCGEDLSNKYKIKHTHHIDKNRRNNSFKNLVTLCNKCHSGVHAGNIDNNFLLLTSFLY